MGLTRVSINSAIESSRCSSAVTNENVFCSRVLAICDSLDRAREFYLVSLAKAKYYKKWALAAPLQKNILFGCYALCVSSFSMSTVRKASFGPEGKTSMLEP